ncbi:hypothetical protein FCY18_24005 [Escherichia coli]|nr:hypothetical protein [Escherichia coli]
MLFLIVNLHIKINHKSKRAARTVLTGMCYSVGSATRQGSSSPTRFIGQSAMTSRGARRIRKKSYAKVFRASVRAETSRLPVCGSAARRNRRLG